MTNLPKKICNYAGCNKVITYSEKYCEEHKKAREYDIKDRYKHYDIKHRDKKSEEFYNSKEWVITSSTVIRNYKGLDIFAYYVEKKIEYANTAHHIIELKEDWDRRLDINNLFPVSSSTHGKIHKLYLTNKKETQELLFNLLERFKKEFMGGGS